jgi:hypothetical protein
MEEKLVASACFSPTGTSKGFKADYGLRLMQQGVSPTTDLFFYGLPPLQSDDAGALYCGRA